MNSDDNQTYSDSTSCNIVFIHDNPILLSVNVVLWLRAVCLEPWNAALSIPMALGGERLPFPGFTVKHDVKMPINQSICTCMYTDVNNLTCKIGFRNNGLWLLLLFSASHQPSCLNGNIDICYYQISTLSSDI